MANVEALEHLKRVIRDAPKDLFDMGVFSHTTNCGTAHCAAGWAAVDPWFQKNTPILEGFTTSGEDMQDSDEVLAKTFGLSGNVADSIFYFTDGTKEEVIEVIDNIIDGASDSDA